MRWKCVNKHIRELEQAIDSGQNKRGNSSATDILTVDVAVVGAGFAGIYAIHSLRSVGFSIVGIEAAPEVGGTWYWNRYPGARCDSDSFNYSYSFSEELEQEWEWTERYPGQPEILRYLKHAADRFDVRREILFSTRVIAATFADDRKRWIIETDTGRRISAQFCIFATGCLSIPNTPQIAGIDHFAGAVYHSSAWPEKGVDFNGKRVGIIGTGSSAIQMTPLIAEQATSLSVFQRTANFSVPARNHPLDPIDAARCKQHYRALRHSARQSMSGVGGHPDPEKSIFDEAAEQRRRNFEAMWQKGGSETFLIEYRDILTNGEANAVLSDFVRDKIRATVCNPVTAEALLPHIPFGAKRLCLDTNYYETFNRDTVSLVNLRDAPIVEITPRGISTSECEYALDAIIFATGFDAMTGTLLAINPRGRGGLALKEKWRDGPLTYLGLMTAGFPNMFVVAGPGSPSVKTNVVLAGEQHVEWLTRCLAHMRRDGLSVVEVTPEDEQRWVAHVNEVADETLFPTIDSWYLGSNIPGKPRVFMPYVGGFARYEAICEEVAASDYRGFVMQRETAKGVADGTA